MKPARQEQERLMRSAYDMLKRSKSGGAITAQGNGPIDPTFALGWAKEALRRALDLPESTDQLTDEPR